MAAIAFSLKTVYLYKGSKNFPEVFKSGFQYNNLRANLFKKNFREVELFVSNQLKIKQIQKYKPK